LLAAVTWLALTVAASPQDFSSWTEGKQVGEIASHDSTRDRGGAYETDLRILHGHEVRWISARGRGDDQGIVGRIMSAVFADATVRKLAEEARETITGETQHRIKYRFGFTSVPTAIAAGAADSEKDMAKDLIRRLSALSVAHNLIHPAFSEQPGATPGNLPGVLLKACSEIGAGTHSVSIAAPEVLVGEHSITAQAMTVHELANSTSYGALELATKKPVSGQVRAARRRSVGEAHCVGYLLGV
jgi:hypothetical protein